MTTPGGHPGTQGSHCWHQQRNTSEKAVALNKSDEASALWVVSHGRRRSSTGVGAWENTTKHTAERGWDPGWNRTSAYYVCSFMCRRQ